MKHLVSCRHLFYAVVFVDMFIGDWHSFARCIAAFSAGFVQASAVFLQGLHWIHGNLLRMNGPLLRIHGPLLRIHGHRTGIHGHMLRDSWAPAPGCMDTCSGFMDICSGIHERLLRTSILSELVPCRHLLYLNLHFVLSRVTFLRDGQLFLRVIFFLPAVATR